MGGTKEHHKRSDGNTGAGREPPCRRWDMRHGCTPLPYLRLSTGHLTLRMGHGHGYSGSCIQPLLRDRQHVESSHSFSMEEGEEKTGLLYAFFPKMRCGGQSCQNGCPSPKWMVGEQNCPQTHFLERADGGGTTSTPFWREQGTLPQVGTVGDAQAFLVGNDSPE